MYDIYIVRTTFDCASFAVFASPTMTSHGQSTIVHRAVAKEEAGFSNDQIEKIGAGPPEDVDIDPALDRAITRKFDKHIIPWLFGLWLLAFIGLKPF